jgi:hypothetical protein
MFPEIFLIREKNHLFFIKKHPQKNKEYPKYSFQQQQKTNHITVQQSSQLGFPQLLRKPALIKHVRIVGFSDQTFGEFYSRFIEFLCVDRLVVYLKLKYKVF